MVEDVVRVGEEGRLEPRVEERIGLVARRRRLVERLVAAVGGEAVEDRGELRALRLLRVIAVHPLRIVADRVDDEPAHDPVAARHRRRQRCHRHGDVHHARIFLRPDPRFHAAHRIAEQEPQVLDAQVLVHEALVRLDHVAVVVARKACAQAVGRFARLAVADGVGKDDVVARRVERLARAEELAGEGRRQQTGARSGRAVQQHYGLARRIAHRRVVQAQLRQHLPRMEAEVAHHPGRLPGRGIVGGKGARGEGERGKGTD